MWSPSNKRDSLINSDDTFFPFLFHFPGSHPRQMLSSFFASRSRGSWIPAVDISEQDDGYILVADLPEVKKEDLRVYTESSSIICISGNRKHILKQDEHQLLVAERGAGRFERCFDLPTSVDSSKIKASFNDQQLNLSIPKLRNSKSGASNSVTID
ncbi:putative heat shock protein 20 [Leishmania major strain Friedlin]|uniref:Putative heat shock protein 20 n=2 Tax=Leishmania major TaxID=5664 RepID=E9AEA7_LEIMA|nr:putative heat shock protein 20 [Leishmania major strain Friedlin]CAG9577986.1 heat_shock_protein_20_-_putative [Leishmania major strain Friedlin]CBZ12586.1 putative heat shock protein 20 [Leishmania major strain Friedlin]|eukprot:XP_003722328.1 putative heat shock protein 20 [Leishmania major strain Friedlin]